MAKKKSKKTTKSSAQKMMMRDKDMMMKGKWIQKAVAKMKKRGTLGSFGKTTGKKIKAGLKAGGKRAKKAIFAKNMKKIAAGRKRR